MADTIPLSDVLRQISDELLLAEEYAKSRGDAVMQFQECEIEFAVELAKEGEAGVKIYVAKIGGAIKKTETNTIKVKFGAIPERPTQAASQTDSGGEPIVQQPRQPSPRGK